MIRSSALASSLALASFALAASCGIGDIDRTQPNKLRKGVLAGEWYYQQTVVDVPYSTSFTFIGEQTEKTERLTWDIQEHFLIAYRSYDLVAGTDGPSTLPGGESDNVPLAIFPIESHFDVAREYNAQTGEQTNVLVENSFDRPWFEREWMRVDWSQNLAPNFNFLVGNVTQVPGAHYVQQPGDPDALLFATKNADGTWSDFQGDAVGTLTAADYFDVVHRIFATPETILIEDWDGTLYEEPACWYLGYLGGAADCAPAEITIRSSFLKVDEGNAYQPKSYPDNQILRDEDGEPIRVDYVDRDSLRPNSAGFVARAAFFDKFGYFRIEREAYDRRHGETHSGKEYLINRFNIWADAPGCVRAGEAAPYAACTVKPIVYYTSPGFPAELREQAQITVDGWNRAFQRTVNKLKYDDARPLEEVEDVVVLRDNSYAAPDGASVTDRGQRLGDLRFNLLAWVDNPNLAGLLGYGPSASDPLTGEIVQASAFVYGAGVDDLAQYGKEVVDLTNDPTLFDQYIAGEDVQLDVYLRRAQDPDARQRTQRFAQEKINSERNRGIRRLGKEALRQDGGSRRARLDALRDTPLEQRLASDELRRAWLGAHAAAPEAAATADSSTEGSGASPRAWAMGRAAHRERLRRKHLEGHSVTHSRYFDSSVVGVALELRDLPAEERYQELRRRVFRSTAEHEMGHNLGLRHNFEASSDALNYGREFWELKGTGAQALELPTEEQLQAGIRQHQYASIMDYGSRFMSDIEGLGLYDEAAIAFGYGDLVEVFAEEPNENLLELYTLPDAVRHRHYTHLPEVFGGIEGMHERRLVPYASLIDQMAGNTTWDLWEVPYRFCSDEYEGATSTCAVFDEGADAYEIAEAARRQYVEYFPFLSFQRDRRYFNEWDYMWSVQSRVFWPMLTQYQNHVFDSFYEEYAYDCTVSDEGACDYADGPDATYYDLAAVPWAESDDGGLPGAAATRLLLDTLGEVIAQPEPGSYFFDDAEKIQVLYSYYQDPLCPPGAPAPDCSELNVALGEGRFTDSQWDVESGYTFYDRLQMVGSFYDKLIALETAVTSDTYFLGVDSGADVGRFAIGLSLYFPEEIHRLIGGTSAEDYPQYAGVMCTEGQAYVPPRLSDLDATRCDGGTFQVVDPATSFTIELYAIWYGMAFLPSGFDLDFNDRMKIWLEGSGEQLTPADPALLVTFTNPLNNRIYHATKHADPAVYSPGAALLERAQGFADAYNLEPTLDNRWRLENLVTTIEDVRGTWEIYGTFYF